MANRDLLKEAIADAKAVKETAIANAKVALEEAFGSRMQELLKEKIAKMDLEEDLEEADEKMEEDLEETYDTTEEAMDMKYMEEAEKVDEVDLEELLRELDEIETESLYEETSEPHGNIGAQTPEGVPLGFLEEEDDTADDDEEIDIENMDEDDLKKFIEDVIADMVAAGELYATIGSEEGEEEEGDEDDDENDGDEEEGEINEMKKEMEEAENVNEAIITTAIAIVGGLLTAAGSAIVKAYNDYSKEKQEKIADMTLKLISNGIDGEEAAKQAYDTVTDKMSAAPGSDKYVGGKGGFSAGTNLEEELEEAYNTIKTIKEELSEVNLFNAKLLYTNKIFKAKNLTESQKVKVLAAFDKAASVNEAKLVFETLSEGFKEKKSSVNESMLRGSASKVTGVVEKKPIMEVNDQFTRWQKLAGIK